MLDNWIQIELIIRELDLECQQVIILLLVMLLEARATKISSDELKDNRNVVELSVYEQLQY